MTMTYAMISLQDYATFETVNEMDQNVRQFNGSLKRPHYETLNILKQYSLKIVGVSHLKIETIANGLNKSASTVKRHIKYLKDHGYITVVNTSRVKQGGKGANAYIINTVEYRKKWLKNKNDLSKMNHRENGKKGGQYQSQQAFMYIKTKKQTIKFLNLLNSLCSTSKRKYKIIKDKLSLERQAAIKNATFTNRYIPMEIYKRFKPFFTDKQLNALYKTANQSLAVYDLNDTDRIDAIIYAMESLIKAMQRHKRGRGEQVYNMYAYLKRTLTHIGFNGEVNGNIYAYTDAEDYREFISN